MSYSGREEEMTPVAAGVTLRYKYIDENIATGWETWVKCKLSQEPRDG